MVENSELEGIGHELADVNTTIGLIQNYLSCIQLQVSQSKREGSFALVIHSLTNEKGLNNVMDNLMIVETKINELVNKTLK